MYLICINKMNYIVSPFFWFVNIALFRAKLGEGPNFESSAKCPDLLGIESLTPWGTPTSI